MSKKNKSAFYSIKMGFLLFASVCFVYSNGIEVPFQYDDLHSIRDNPNIKKISNIPVFFKEANMFTADERSSMYRPIVLVSYALNYYFDGLRVNGYHWLNIFVHSVNSVLLIVLGRRLGLTGPAGIFSAFLFAFHPINTETVNYLSSRSESLSALFTLCALISYTALRSKRHLSLVLYLTSVFCFCLSLLTKSVGLMLIPVIFLYEWTFFTRKGSLAFYRLAIPYVVVGIFYVYKVRSMLEISLVTAPVRSLETQISTQFKAMIQYVDWLFFPWPLSVEPSFTEGTEITLFLLCIAISISVAWFWWKSNSIIHFCIGWAFLSILPTILVPLNVLVNEHRLYLVTMSFTIGLCSLFQQHQGKRLRKVSYTGILAITIFICMDFIRTQEWLDPRTLWQSAKKVGPHMPRPHIFLGDLDYEAGFHERAIQNYARALIVQPNHLSGGDMFSIYSGIGRANLALGKWAQAKQSYSAALRIDPRSESTKNALTAINALHSEAKRKKSEDLLREGLLALVSGQLETAIDMLNKSVVIMPEIRNLQALAKAYARAEKLEQSDSVYNIIQNYEIGDEMSDDSQEKPFE